METVALAIRFDLGRYHATPWGTHVNEAQVEWPPSPWRILRALMAVGYSHVEVAGDRAALHRALTALARAAPPRYALPPSTEAHTRHYIPSAKWSPTKSGETALVIDAFRAVDPEAELRVVWDEVALDAPARDALRAAVEALPTLGRSESLCAATLDDQPLAIEDAHAVPAAEAAGWDGRDLRLWTVDPRERDSIEILGVSVTELRKARTLMPVGIVPAAYRLREPDPSGGRATDDIPRPTIAHLRVVGKDRPAFTDTVSLASFLRAAVQRKFGDLARGGVSPVLSGHYGSGGRRTDQHRHAHFLTGHDRDSKRIDHLWIWAPEGFGPDEVRAISALMRLHWTATGETREPLHVALVALGTEQTLTLPDLVGPARCWRSETPFIPPRHEKRKAGRLVDGPVDQIQRELRHRGLPPAASVELVRDAWQDFSQRRAGKPHQTRGAIGAKIVFDNPVQGPLTLGALSHFGLGRFRPLP